MPTETANYGFTKDNEDEFYNVNNVNANLDKIDTEMKRIEDESKSFNQQVIDNTNAIANANTKLDTHIKDDEGHTRWFGNATGTNAKTIITTKPLPIDSNGDPINGASFRFMNSTTNTGAVTMFVTHANGTTKTYPVYNNGIQLKAGDLPSTTVHTITFAGGAFHLQGKGGGVSSPAANYRVFPLGSTNFVVPEGVTRIVAYLWGGGGGGGGAQKYRNIGGGGGGSGGFKKVILHMNPGTNLSVFVGAGGVGGPYTDSTTQNANGGTGGGDSYVSGMLNHGGAVIAYGGGGGAGGWITSGMTSNGGEGGQDLSKGRNSWIGNVSEYKNGTFVRPNTSLLPDIICSITGSTGSHTNSIFGGGGGGSPSDGGVGTTGGDISGGSSWYQGGTTSPHSTYWSGAMGGYGYSSVTNGADASGIGAGGAGGNANYAPTYNGGKGGNGFVVLAW